MQQKDEMGNVEKEDAMEILRIRQEPGVGLKGVSHQLEMGTGNCHFPGHHAQ